MALSAFCYDPECGNWSEAYFNAALLAGSSEEDGVCSDEHPDFSRDDDTGDDFHPHKKRHWGSEKGRGRHRSKAVTLRSWRDLRALGGSRSRKAVVLKMDRRRPVKPLIYVPFEGPSGWYLMG